MKIKKMTTSRVIGALGPLPRGGAPGAPGAATPPPEKKIFLFFVSFVSVSGQDIGHRTLDIGQWTLDIGAPPPEKKIFLFSSVSVSGQDIDMEGED